MHKFEKTGYRPIFKVTKIEWCFLMAGARKSNYLFNIIINIIKESTSGKIFHKCRNEGKLEITSQAMKNNKLLSICPQGKYRIDFKIFNDHNDVLVYFEVEVGIILD